jgi:hypothetical protein
MVISLPKGDGNDSRHASGEGVSCQKQPLGDGALGRQQLSQHVVQNAAVAEIFHFIEGIDAAE